VTRPLAIAVPLRRHADFMRLWTGETISSFGSQVTQLALPLAAVLTLSAGPLEMGLLTAAGLAPYLVVALPAGAWIDRLRARRRLMVLADLGRAALLASVPLAFAADALTITQLYVVALSTGTLTVLFNTAFTTVLPGLVPEHQLADANGRLQTSAAAAQVAGPGIAGLLVQALSAPAAIVIDAVSFVLSAVAIGSMSAGDEATKPVAERRPLRAEVGEGLRFVAGDASLRAIVGSAATLNLFGVLILSILILYARRDLHLAPGAIGLIFAAGGVGALIGALSAPWLSRALGQGRSIFAATVWFSVHLLVVPIASGPHAAEILAANELLGGVAVMVFDVNAMTLAQLATPAEMLGRMGATMGFVTQGAKPLGALLGGVLGELMGLHGALWVAGAGGTLTVLWTWFSPLRDRPSAA
jgi:MFS family permease